VHVRGALARRGLSAQAVRTAITSCSVTASTSATAYAGRLAGGPAGPGHGFEPAQVGFGVRIQDQVSIRATSGNCANSSRLAHIGQGVALDQCSIPRMFTRTAPAPGRPAARPDQHRLTLLCGELGRAAAHRSCTALKAARKVPVAGSAASIAGQPASRTDELGPSPAVPTRRGSANRGRDQARPDGELQHNAERTRPHGQDSRPHRHRLAESWAEGRGWAACP